MPRKRSKAGPRHRRRAIELRVGDAPEIEAFLVDRIYEFHARATGCFDAEVFSATQRDDADAIRAGIYG
jgi:hypothetical protein